MLQRGTNIMANQVKTSIQNYFEKVLYENLIFKFKFFIDMKSNKGLSSATIQSTDIHKT